MSDGQSDRDVDEWLAAATGVELDQVRRELDEGERRRIFVADELIEAGFTGPPLLDGVMRLTGLDEISARALIDERSPTRSLWQEDA